MEYIKWNNAIGQFFFNEERAEQEVYLFISKVDIIAIGKGLGLDLADEDIFHDYIESIRVGLPEKPLRGNILEQALFTFRKWKDRPNSIEGVSVEYPLYMSYLALFVLPLTESESSNLRVDAYYPRIWGFLKRYDLPPMPTQYENNNWNEIWEDLFNWSFEERNTELGYFEIHPFRNKRWVYVGKPLSQSLFPIHAIRLLSRFYEIAGLVPGEDLESSTIRKLLVAYGGRQLGLSQKILSALQDRENELGQSIISIVKKNYSDWTGNTDQYDSVSDTIRKGNTIAQLRICIEGDTARGYKTYFRLYTKLDFPEDLTFTYENKEFKCQQFGKGWSKPLFLPYIEDLIVLDKLNKWKAKFSRKQIRLMADGKGYHMSGWVEVPFMIASRMLLLANEELANSIEEWGSLFSKGDFKKLPDIGIPEDQVLYEIKNPPIPHPDIPALQYKTEKSISIFGGIKTGVRTWLHDLLPDVELDNGFGTENVYLEYVDNEQRIPLKQKEDNLTVWSLPAGIMINKGFYLRVEGEDIKGGLLKNYIVDSMGKVEVLCDESLPPRDKYGRIVCKDEISSFSIGSNLAVENERKYWLRQSPYSLYFRPNRCNSLYQQPNEQNFLDYNYLLLCFLTVKGQSTVKDYFEAFEAVYLRCFSPDQIESHSIELSRLKRWSLNYMDYMGFLDYEYSTKKIVVNPPQILLIPSTSGRKALLIGGRTPELIQKLKAEAEKERVYLEIESQDSSLCPFMLPPTITISVTDEDSGIKNEQKLTRIAQSCSICFDPIRLPQFRLAEFSASLDDYKSELKPNERFDDSGWPAWCFDVQQLRFVPIDVHELNKTYSLVEYRLTEYSFKHMLWINGLPHEVNKNWGRYLVLNHFERSVIFNDRKKNIIAIPATMPLPRLIAEAMTLFSGKAPRRLMLDIEGIKTRFNIYENIPPIFASNYFKKVGQPIKESNIDL